MIGAHGPRRNLLSHTSGPSAGSRFVSLLKEGRLYLSLMADGGIYEYEPLPR
jgi:hypothetical protein